MKTPLRFCMITTFYPPYNFGGDGLFVRALSHELAERGHQVEVIFCKDAYRFLARREPPPIADPHPNIILHGLESPVGVLSPLASQQTGRLLFKQKSVEKVLQQGFDVIHFHNISLLGGPEVLTYGRGIKLYTPHEYWLVCPMHVLYRYNREVCEKPDCLACTLSFGRPPQWWRYTDLLKQAVKQVDRFLAPSRFALEAHKARGFNPGMTYLPLFLPRPAAPVKSTPVMDAAADGPYFLYVGRLEKIKGLQTVIPVFRQHPRARLLIAGRGNYETELKALAGEAANIRFLGHLDQDRLQGLYSNATALIVPSVNYEISPLVIMEALSQRTPVIARDLGGMTELIQDSGGGLLFRDDASLLEAIETLLADSTLGKAMGERGYETYQRNWTPEAYMDRYLGLIEEIELAKHTGAANSQLND